MTRQDGTRKVRFPAVAAVAALLLSTGYAAAKDPVEIGMAVALTGSLASNDAQYVDGVKLALKQVNDAGGADGHELRIHILDNNSNATTGVTVTNQLLNQFNVSVMLNGTSSAQNVAIHPILARNKVPMLMTSQLPPDPAWGFLALAAYQRVLEHQLQFAKQKLHATKVAFLYSQTPYGQNGAKLLATRSPELGLQVVFSEGVEGSSTDMTPQLAKIKAAEPDVVMDFLTGPAHIVEAKAAATVGLKAPLVMAFDDSATSRQATEAYPNAYTVTMPIQQYPNVADPQIKQAIEDFLKVFDAAGLDRKFVVGAGYGWDAVHTLAKAIEISHATSGDALRAAIEKVDVVGVTTRFKFSPDDHTGQMSVSDPLSIGQYGPSGMKLFPIDPS